MGPGPEPVLICGGRIGSLFPEPSLEPSSGWVLRSRRGGVFVSLKSYHRTKEMYSLIVLEIKSLKSRCPLQRWFVLEA